ncbi:gastrin-releasing peptide [Pristis pectinata]|uniref:gastrin-releasing peptide n=1 Tax=Pristis pectinata TaxID=685728 RepID=UPI00223DAAE2|nr:gastrin-releasing peptide [Pristis pectinata]
MGSEPIFWKHRLLFSLIVFSIATSKVHYGLAAPVQNQGKRTKQVPTGSQWAVGHLMGKRTFDDTLYGYTNRDNMIYPVPSGIAKQPEDDLQLAEIAKKFLNLREETSSTNIQKSREDITVVKKPQQTTDYNIREMVDYLLQVMDVKDETPR